MTMRAADGTPISLPCIFPAGVYMYITGAGDHATEGRGKGQVFALENESSETDATVEWQFNDLVFTAGGGASFLGGVLGDWISLEIVAPATPVTPNGGGTGNCNVVDGVILPAASNGAFDVDLDDAIPVPAMTGIDTYNGYWDWDSPLIGRGTVSASATPGSAKYHLIAAEVVLVRYANRLQLLGGGDLNLTLSAIEPKAQFPHWKGRVTLHNHTGHADLQATWFIITGRAVTL